MCWRRMASNLATGSRCRWRKAPEALFLYLACLRAGAIYLPLNTGYTASELALFHQDAEPRVFVCSPKNRETDCGFMSRQRSPDPGR